MKSLINAIFAFLPVMAGMLLTPALSAAALCNGAGLPTDAPLFYLVSAEGKDRGAADVPSAGMRSPETRERLTDLFGRDDVDVFLFNRDQTDAKPLHDGRGAGLFRSVNLNGDRIDDFFIYEPAGAFYYIMLYAGCGDDFYTPVGAFDSRELPVPARYVPPTGTGDVKWAEFEVIAPDKTVRHADPLVNWARRTWRFDGTLYRQVKIEPLQ